MKFEWCFELGSVVKVADIEGTEPNDEFEITDRKVEDDVQYFILKRMSDRKLWIDVPASLIL